MPLFNAPRRKPLIHQPGHSTLPPNLSPAELQAATGQAPAPVASPLIPTKAVPWIALFVAAAAAVAAGLPDLFPHTELDQQVAGFIVTVGAIFGIVSPGMQKRVR